MKKIATLLFATFGIIALHSCTDDDDAIHTDGENIVGTYRMIAWDAPVSQDLDGDGDSSVNLVTEGTCYTDWTITLHNDQTFTRQWKNVTVVDGAVSCAVDSDSGTWSKQGNIVTLLDLEGTELNSEFSYLEATQSLSQTRQDEFPTTFEEIYIMEAGTITVIYVRE